MPERFGASQQTVLREHALRVLVALAVLNLASGAGGQRSEEDYGIRITAPMNGWALPYDRPVAISLFALWPPCSGRPGGRTCTAGQGTCKNSHGSGGQCETRVLINGHHILTHVLSADNQYTFSGVLPAGSLPLGEHQLSITHVCKGPRETPPVRSASSSFSIVDLAVWKDLGDEGETVRGEEEEDSAEKHLLSSVPYLNQPRATASSVGSDGLEQEQGNAGARRRRMRCAVMFYHANVRRAYQPRWMDKSVLSILSQTYQHFDIYELNYGDHDSSKDSVVQAHIHLLQGKHYTFLSTALESHAAAMNYLLDKIFADGYDVVFNVNVDDYYAPTRFQRQLDAIALGAHLVSCEFVRITADATGARDRIHIDYEPTYLTTRELFGERMEDKRNAHGVREADEEDIYAQLASDHNVLCHPGIAFTREFWGALATLQCHDSIEIPSEAYEHANQHTAHTQLSVCSNSKQGGQRTRRPLRYRHELPAEDLRLWQRALLMSDITAVVVPEVLVYYRIHEQQISPLDASGMDTAWHTKMRGSGDFQHKLRLGILTVCTGRYCEHLERHLRLLLTNFLAEHGKTCYIFTDEVEGAKNIVARLSQTHDFSASIVPIRGRGFPADTLYRYHYFLQQEQHILTHTDVVYYMDVDLVVAQRIRAFEVVPSIDRPLIAVRHMLQDGAGTPESRPESRAYIEEGAVRQCYFAGGFLGGRSPEFVALARSIAAAVDVDDAWEVVAIWHDESHLNKYLSDNYDLVRPLSPAYLYPDTWDIPYQPRIVVQKVCIYIYVCTYTCTYIYV